MNYNELWHQLAPLYGDGEAKAIAQMVYEVRFGLSLSDIYLGKDTQLSADDQAELKEIAKRLADNEPVQYVLGVADFCGRQYHVEPGILIPRPETEHLCRLITKHVAIGSANRKVLDIGTGSGCIAITLALDIPNSQVTAWDISPIALRVAKGNAEQLGANVNVIENDMLQQTYQVAPQWDLIVSNPPYICDSEAEEMDANVLDYEPEIALFVPDDDPLQFYVPIMNYAQSALHPGGELWLETNPLYEEIIEERLLELGFNVTAHDDQFGKTRFIQAIR
ncbi:MAG: peptide chain release factor N(5)-glutamine methyltransferase [Prevotella sp.]|nr:peptide chain release factor N(5)-glutamine methyltransferase [Prevotella sp.]